MTMTNLCDDCIHAMVQKTAVHYYDYGDGICPIPVIYCDKTHTWIDGAVTTCKYHQTDDAKYRAAQDRGSEKIPGKVYRWDCCVISEKCRECEHYHRLSEGEDPHKCPFGLKQRLRRIG